MIQTIVLEERVCEHCSQKFKVMPKSASLFCSSFCMEYGGKGGVKWSGDRQKVSKEESNKLVSVTVNVGQPTQSIGLDCAKIAKHATTAMSKSKEKTVGDIMQTTRPSVITSALYGAAIMPIESSPTNEPTTTSGEKITPQVRESAATSETPLVLSTDSANKLELAGLDSMSLLQKSGNRLMRLMDESVSDSDLEQAADGTKRVESHRIIAAVECATALKDVVQTQVNMLKALTEFQRQ